MTEAAIVVARLLQYFGASIVFGAPLLFALARPAAREWNVHRRLVAGGAVGLLAGAALALFARAGQLAGSLDAGLDPATLADVVSYFGFGKASAVQAVAASVALGLTAVRARWPAIMSVGAVAAASLAWLGHAASGEGTLGTLHLLNDAVHALTAAAWIGALAALLVLARSADADGRVTLHRALSGFSRIGIVLVATLVLTGLANGLALVGLAGALELPSTTYGRLLIAKLALFAVMLGLAAVNRWRLTPLLRADPVAAAGTLKRTVTAELAAGIGVLVLVAWLGTLQP